VEVEMDGLGSLRVCSSTHRFEFQAVFGGEIKGVESRDVISQQAEYGIRRAGEFVSSSFKALEVRVKTEM
jgi:hypothetical protein